MYERPRTNGATVVRGLKQNLLSPSPFPQQLTPPPVATSLSPSFHAALPRPPLHLHL